MRKLAPTLAVVLLVVLCVYSYTSSRSQMEQMRATNERVDRLTQAVEVLVARLEQVLQEKQMADVNLTDGDPALDHAVTAGPWTSGTQTVELTVYKATANETSAEFRVRYRDAVDKAMTAYPPNTN